MKEHMKVIPPSAQRLIDIVSSITGEDITKNSRKRTIVAARSIYYKILKDHEGWSLVRTGAPLNKDHATVKHGIATLDHFISIEKNLNEMYRRCLNLYVNNEDVMDPISRTEVDERISKLDNLILDLNSYIADLKAENSTLKKELSMYGDFTSMLKLMVPPSKMGAAIKKTRAVLNGL